MPLKLNVSNSLSVLARHLSSGLQQATTDVFLPQYVVTQTAGMNSWLKLQIATANGIAANIVYVSPNDVIQKIYYVLGGRFPNMLSAQNLSWLLYHILSEQHFVNRFKQVASYYYHQQPDADLKRMALAEKTADLFDQYQIYRPEWIEDWNATGTQNLAGEKWQQYLWIRAKQLSGDRLPDKTVIATFIKDALQTKAGRETLRNLLPSLHIFGLSIITKYHIDIFFRIAAVTDVQFYMVNPAPAVYWFEDRSERSIALLQQKKVADLHSFSTGNPLLSSWGRIIQDTFMMLYANDTLLNNAVDLATDEPASDSLLHKIQADIFNAASSQDYPLSPTDLNDSSLTVSSCFTIAREVEVLYNYLVHLVDVKKVPLSPRDVVVMVTDINAYAPYIKSVFSNAPYRFQFTIADETYENGDSIIAALSALLALNRFNFKAEQVLQLLDSSQIKKRFSITDTALLRRVVSAANIHFGLEGSLTDDTHYVSWAYGIRRIVTGLCMSSDEPFVFKDGDPVYPVDLVEGSESLELIRFAHFIKVLMQSVVERDHPRTIAAWVEYIERLLQNLVCDPEEETSEDYLLLQEQLRRFNVSNEFLPDPVSFEIFAHSLLQSIGGASRSASFAGGGITFCSLIPMRSIPFKVVALLGLNYDNFPRKEAPVTFNLIENDTRRRGDRNVKENDKHLFLETVCSAKDFLYVSYLGQSVKDNTTMPPSALVDELLDYIEQNCLQPGLVRPALVTKHPLHSFSQKYGVLKSWPNYLDHKKVVAGNQVTERQAGSGLDFSEVTLERLVSFFRHPVRTYYQQVLNIRYNEENVLLSDTELFELDKLQQLSVKTRLLQNTGNDLDLLQRQLVVEGSLPLKNMAHVQLNKLQQEVMPVQSIFRETVGNVDKDSVAVNIDFGTTSLVGNIPNLYGDKMVFVSFSASEKDILDANIYYLAAIAAGLNVQLYYISQAKQARFIAAAITKVAALKQLDQLLQLYKAGHEKIMGFHPNLLMHPKDVEEFNETALDKALKKIFGNDTKPCHDPYLNNLYNSGFYQSEALAGEIRENAAIIIKPLEKVFPGFFT